MDAILYDKKSSNGVAAKIRFEGKNIVVQSDNDTHEYGVESVKISDRLGDMPRFVELPSGKVCECGDNEAIDAFLAQNNKERAMRFVHFLESKLRYAAAALVVTALTAYVILTYGMPIAAKHIADAIPEQLAYKVGADAFGTLDGQVFFPSKLDTDKQERLKKYFYSHLQNQTEHPKIAVHFRSSPIGANALAFPDGSIVLTDELVNLAKDDKELLSIFFHELGHVEKRHALRSVLQNSGAYVIIIALTGDVASAGSMLTAMPTLLVESGYSRDMEFEADAHALGLMKKYKIEGRYFADILERLTKDEPYEKMTAYLGSHPLTKERIVKFRAN